MNITLKQNEIEFALRQYLLQRGLGEAVKTMPIKFGTTRNPFGITADLELPIEGTLPDATPAIGEPIGGFGDMPKNSEPFVFEADQNPVTSGDTVGNLLANAGNVIETTQAMDVTEAKVETAAIEGAPPAVETVTYPDAVTATGTAPLPSSSPEEVVQQQPVIEAAPEPVAQAPEAVVEEAKPVEAPAQTPAAAVDNLFASPVAAAAPAAQPAQAAPIQTTSLFGN